MFPLVPVPEWLVQFMPSIFAAEVNHQITTIGAALGLLFGFARIWLPLVHGKNDPVSKQFAIEGLAFLSIAILFLILGAYLFVLLIVIAGLGAAAWLLMRIRTVIQ